MEIILLFCTYINSTWKICLVTCSLWWAIQNIFILLSYRFEQLYYNDKCNNNNNHIYGYYWNPVKSYWSSGYAAHTSRIDWCLRTIAPNEVNSLKRTNTNSSSEKLTMRSYPCHSSSWRRFIFAHMKAFRTFLFTRILGWRCSSVPLTSDLWRIFIRHQGIHIHPETPYKGPNKNVLLTPCPKATSHVRPLPRGMYGLSFWQIE